MMLVVGVPLFVTILGLVLYFAAGDKHPKVGEVGRIAFAFGLLALLLAWGDAPLRLGR
jgi:hypothetical protein